MKFGLDSYGRWDRRTLHNLYGVLILQPQCFEFIRESEKSSHKRPTTKAKNRKTS